MIEHEQYAYKSIIRACWYCRIFPLLGAYSSVLLNEAPSRCDDDWEFEMEMKIKQMQPRFKYDPFQIW